MVKGELSGIEKKQGFTPCHALQDANSLSECVAIVHLTLRSEMRGRLYPKTFQRSQTEFLDAAGSHCQGSVKKLEVWMVRHLAIQTESVRFIVQKQPEALLKL